MRTLAGILVMVVCVACDEELSEPEIWIDISPVSVGTRSISPDLDPLHFDLQFINRGEQTLEIYGFNIRGDRNCSFVFEGPDNKNAGEEKLELGENQSTFVRGWYKPRVVGEDQISLEMSSNAGNFPLLIVPICGRGVLPETVDAGPGPVCNVPPPDQPDCPTR